MLAKHEATAVSHRHVSLSHQLCPSPAGQGETRSPAVPSLAGATAGKEQRVPGLALPKIPLNYPRRAGAGLDSRRGCSPVCQAPGWGVWGSSAQNSPQVMCPSLELKLYRVLRGLHSPSLSLL